MIAPGPERRLRAAASAPWMVVMHGTEWLRAARRISEPSDLDRLPRGVLTTSCTRPRLSSSTVTSQLRLPQCVIFDEKVRGILK